MSLDPPSIDVRAYRRAMSYFATGVTVATTLDSEGRPVALTANTFTSVSLDPVLVLLCVQRSARFHDAVLASGVWAVSVLAADQEYASRHFSSAARHSADDQFAGIEVEIGRSGVTVLSGALATFECHTTDALQGGDHLVLMGSVTHADLRHPLRSPLLFYRGRYAQVQPGGQARRGRLD